MIKAFIQMGQIIIIPLTFQYKLDIIQLLPKASCDYEKLPPGVLSSMQTLCGFHTNSVGTYRLEENLLLLLLF